MGLLPFIASTDKPRFVLPSTQPTPHATNSTMYIPQITGITKIISNINMMAMLIVCLFLVTPMSYPLSDDQTRQALLCPQGSFNLLQVGANISYIVHTLHITAVLVSILRQIDIDI